MKKLFGIIAVSLAVFAAAPDAEARNHRGSGRYYVEYHHHCHGPAWVETYLAYYDRYGHPVYRTRVIPIHHHHRRHHHHRPRHRDHGHGHAHFSVSFGH
ncbi:MAG: hypothetical protein V4733_10840 [Verrucomicrobiota bacterium]